MYRDFFFSRNCERALFCFGIWAIGWEKVMGVELTVEERG